jgi:SAM-dependent methyltransferase
MADHPLLGGIIAQITPWYRVVLSRGRCCCLMCAISVQTRSFSMSRPVRDFVVCQQGLQFFPDRLAALSEMRRALKPGGGQLAIAAWSHIEDNAFYAALHAALRESVPGDLAGRLLAPFSWPDAQVLKNTLEAAGFHEIRVRSATLPLIFEGRIA